MEPFKNNVFIALFYPYFSQDNKNYANLTALWKWLHAFTLAIGFEINFNPSDEELNYDEEWQLYWIASLYDQDHKEVLLFGNNTLKFKSKYGSFRVLKLFIRKNWSGKNKLAQAIFDAIYQINLADSEVTIVWYLVTIYEAIKKYDLYQESV